MKMEKELLKCLIDFYSKLDNVDKEWKKLIEKTENKIDALKNQAEQLRHVTSPDVDNAELCKIPGLRDRLIFKIYTGLEDEVALIHENITHFNTKIQDLRNTLNRVEATRSKLSLENENMKELVDGTTRRPKLNLLLEWAIDTSYYYQNVYFQISNNLKALNYKDETSIEKLSESFLQKQSVRMKINRILAYTQFLSQKNCT